MTVDQIMRDQKMTLDQKIEAVKLVTAEQVKAAVASKPAGKLFVKANPENRAVSIYGLGRMPVTLYRSQWERLAAEGLAVLAEFFDAHGEFLPLDKAESGKTVPKNLIGDGKPFRVPKGKAAA